MKIPLFIFIGVMAFALSGCDGISYRQFVVPNATLTDEKAVLSILSTAANTAGLEGKIEESHVTRTLAYYHEPNRLVVVLQAHINNTDIIVNLSSVGPFHAPQAYKTVDSMLMEELPKVFGERLIVYPEPEVPFPNSEEKAASQ